MTWIWYADLGNCTLHWGAWAESSWQACARMGVDVLNSPDGFHVIKEQLAQSNLAPNDCQQAILCVSTAAQSTLVPNFAREFLETETKVLGVDFQADISTEYYHPAQVGQDRLANAVAAVERYGVPVVILDFGSCVTCDAVSAEGVFVGGAIAPGLPAYRHGIRSATPHLEPAIQEVLGTEDMPAKRPGRSTSECLSLGIYYGLAGATDRLVTIMREYLAAESPVVATGGDVETIAPLCHTQMDIEPMLTLDGLRLAYESGQGQPLLP